MECKGFAPRARDPVSTGPTEVPAEPVRILGGLAEERLVGVIEGVLANILWFEMRKVKEESAG